MSKIIFICKLDDDGKDYIERESEEMFLYEKDLIIDVHSIIWHDYERENWYRIEDLTHNELKREFLKYEKEWMAVPTPLSRGISIVRDKRTGRLNESKIVL